MRIVTCLLILLPIISLSAAIVILRSKRSFTLKTRLTFLFLILFSGPTLILTIVSTSLVIVTLKGSAAERIVSTIDGSLEMAREYRNLLGRSIVDEARFLLDKTSTGSLFSGNAENDSLFTDGDLHFLAIFDSRNNLEKSFSRTPGVKKEILELEANKLVQKAGLDSPESGLVLEDFETDSGVLLLAMVALRNDGHLVCGSLLSEEFENRIDLFTRMAGGSGMLALLFSKGGERFIWLVAIFWITSFGALSLFVSTRLSRSISEPLENLVEAAGFIASGHLEHRIEETGDDEIGLLEKAFNEMSASLRRTRGNKLTSSQDWCYEFVDRFMIMEIKCLHKVGLKMRLVRRSFSEVGCKMVICLCADPGRRY